MIPAGSGTMVPSMTNFAESIFPAPSSTGVFSGKADPEVKMISKVADPSLKEGQPLL